MTSRFKLDGLLPLGAMASVLGIQARELRKDALAGRIPCVLIGDGGLLFDPEAVQAALRERARTPTHMQGEVGEEKP